MDVQADIPVRGEPRPSGVQADPKPQGKPAGPIGVGQDALQSERSGQRVERLAEHQEALVGAHIDDLAGVLIGAAPNMRA